MRYIKRGDKVTIITPFIVNGEKGKIVKIISEDSCKIEGFEIELDSGPTIFSKFHEVSLG